jgi:hypothetical protein
MTARFYLGDLLFLRINTDDLSVIIYAYDEHPTGGVGKRNDLTGNLVDCRELAFKLNRG